MADNRCFHSSCKHRGNKLILLNFKILEKLDILLDIVKVGFASASPLRGRHYSKFMDDRKHSESSSKEAFHMLSPLEIR